MQTLSLWLYLPWMKLSHHWLLHWFGNNKAWQWQVATASWACLHFLGSAPPEEMREHQEGSTFLCTGLRAILNMICFSILFKAKKNLNFYCQTLFSPNYKCLYGKLICVGLIYLHIFTFDSLKCSFQELSATVWAC